MRTRRRILIIGVLLILSSVLARAQEEWKEYRGSHFLIYYKDVPEDFVKTVEETAEYYYQQVTNNLGFSRTNAWSWDERAKIYIYDDDEDYYESAKQARWSSGVASAADKLIRTYPTMHGFFDTTLPHELGHIVFREFIGFRASSPLWLDEGVAMYQEKAKRWGANKIVKAAIEDGSFIPLSELSHVRLTRRTPREKVNLFYAEAASIVYYLITEHGKYKFVKLCRNLKEGLSLDGAVYSAYYRFEDLEDLNSAWIEYLKRN